MAAAALSPRRRPEPQINTALPHDREFHLEPSRYINPHRNEEFTEVPPPPSQESPCNLCDGKTRLTALSPMSPPP